MGIDLEYLRNEEPCTAEVRADGGTPRLFINGKETVPFMGLSTSLLPTVDNFRKMGVNLLCPIFGTRAFWKGPEAYDFSRLDSDLAKLLERHPNAFFFPRFHLHTPAWWTEAHPEEVIAYGLPSPASRYDLVKRGVLKEIDGGHFMHTGSEMREASFASELWREETGKMLQALIRHVESSPLKSRMTGYFLMNGRSGEWNTFGSRYFPDYSAPMKKLTGPMPSPRERIFSGYGLLRDPAREGRVIEFYRRYHRAGAETVTYLAKKVKETVPRPMLCGTFFGYLLETPRIQESGYMASQIVLDSPDLDIIAGPYSYQNTNDETKESWESDMVDGGGNWLGRARGVAGDAGIRLMKESIRRRGKLYCHELDPSTHLDVTDSWRDIGGSGSKTLEGSIKISRRDIGKIHGEGIGGWIYDFGPLHGVETGWYGDDDLIEATGSALKNLVKRESLDLSPAADIALLGDMESFFATRHWLADSPYPSQGIREVDMISHWFLDSQSRSLQRIGAPVDYLHRFDFTREDAGKYKLIIVPNTFLMKPEEVTELHSKLKNSGATVIWFYAPGVLSPDKIDLAQMAQLTGFNFQELLKPGPMTIKTDKENLPEVFGIKSPYHYHPRFAVTDESCEKLGVWTDRDSLTAFARKEMEGWYSVFLGTPPLPAEWLRFLASQAGVSLWSDRPDIVNATRSTAMLVACSTGVRTLRLPSPMAPENGGEASAEHRLELDFGDVVLFTAGK
jgi:hypothetical protein